jgi:hypothetical protein
MSGYIGTQPVPQATQTRQTFTATASQTSFATGGYQAGYLDVFLNGVKLVGGTDYTATNGSDVVLTTGAASGDTLEIVAYTAFEAANVTGATDFTVTGSFTSQGIDDNATSTAMTLDSSGNLLVGKTTTSGSVTGLGLYNSGLLEAVADGDIAATLKRLNSDGEILRFRKDSTTVGGIRSRAGVVSTIVLDPRSGQGAGLTGASSALSPVNETGVEVDNKVSLGNSANRFKDLYLSGGVYLGGTGSANLLDDYEEGTFLPTFLGDTTNPSVTYHSGRYGLYTKVGNIVHVSLFIEISALASAGSGGLAVGNLPFTSTSEIYFAGTVGYVSGWDANKAPTRCLAVPNSTKIAVYNQATSDPRSSTARLQCGDLDTQSQVYLQVSYRTS